MTGLTGLVAHERYFWHDAGSGAGFSNANPYAQPDQHPESPESKRRLLGLLEVSGLAERLLRIVPREASIEELRHFHTERYIDTVRRISGAGGGSIGDSVSIGAGSYEIARLAVGGCIEAADAVITGRARNAYALVRPPGHHADADRGAGYCVFGNLVVMVRHAQRMHGLRRVAVIDWDVHHGNGTESAFLDDPTVLTMSIHQDRCYPLDRGGIEENGRGPGRGANINLPLPPGSGHEAYVEAIRRVVLPGLRRFRPELIVIACGLDASAMDPLGRMLATSETFREMTHAVRLAAEEFCRGRLIATHEGGYSNTYVPFCGLAVIEELAGIRTEVIDPYLAEFTAMGGHELLPHQAAAIDAAAALIAAVPDGTR